MIDYRVDKNKDCYIERLKELIADEAVFYRHSRMSYKLIGEMLKNRIKRKYK